MDIASLREQIDRKHREALRALETIAGYLTEAPSAPAVVEASETPAKGDPEARTQGSKRRTRVDRVLAVLSEKEPKTVEQIEAETNLPDHAVRAVLYSKFVKPRVVSEKRDKRVSFRLKSSGTQATNGEEKSAAAIVRELLAKHPNGLSASAINAAVGDEVERMTGSKAAIGAALYNGKKRGKLTYDEEKGTYALVRQ